MSGDIDNRFRRTQIERFPKFGKEKTEDVNYWKHLQFPVTVQEHGPVNYIDICQEAPHYVAVTGSARVQIYNPLTNEVYKALTKFKEGAFGGRFRWDGQLLIAGEEGGAVKLFDVGSKSLLRNFSGHKSAVHRADFLSDRKHVVSFSDDKTAKIWDVPTQEIVANFAEHQDYVRCGVASKVSSDLVVTGSYDHSVKLWDKRQKGESNLTLDHGSPVEDVLLFPNGSILATAGGHEIRIWDLLGGGGRLMAKFCPHSKTITSLSFATKFTRLVSSSLDRQVKFHDVTNFQTVHSIPFPSPLLTCITAPDDSMVCAGTTDGLVQFLHRKVPPSVEEKEETEFRKNNRFLKYTDFTPRPGDLIIRQEKREKESRFDYFLRKFEYTKALDQVLKPFVQKKHPDYTYSVLKELRRRNGLEQALGGRDEKSLTSLLQFITKNINEPKYSALLIEITDLLLDLYRESLGSCPTTDKMFLEIRKRVDREVRNMRHLMTLQGSLDLILAASKSSEEPQLTVEELRLLGRKSEEIEREGEGKPVKSWQKTLKFSPAIINNKSSEY